MWLGAYSGLISTNNMLIVDTQTNLTADGNERNLMSFEKRYFNFLIKKMNMNWNLQGVVTKESLSSSQEFTTSLSPAGSI